tara:strand:+ start:1713 stop:2159 length:447 start_codon:yes stop_codon:yes gene_type:complete
MKVILNIGINGLGTEGEIVSVKDGYARNYLIPRGMAKNATKINVETIKKDIEQRQIQEAKTRENLESLIKQLNKVSLKFALKAGEDDKLFGSVTSQMIADAIYDKGYKIDKKEIIIPEPIKSLGKTFVMIRLGSELEAKVKIKVVSEK